MLHEDHPRPRTRREFLAQGLMAGTAMAMAPTALSWLMSKKAHADERVSAELAGEEFMPFMVFDLAGGAGLPGNFLVGKEGGPEDLLPSYSTLGWDPRKTGYDDRFGVPMAKGVSQLFVGITQTASAEAMKNLRMGSICHISRDDTNINTHSAVHAISKAGLRGVFIERGVGTVNAPSGGNTQVPQTMVEYKPVFVSRFEDLRDGLTGGPVLGGLTLDTRRALFRSIMKMTADQGKRLAGLAGGEQLAALAGDATAKNLKMQDLAGNVDPRVNNDMKQIYAINESTASNQFSVIQATMVMNVISKNTGPGVLTIGGCDYHTGNSTAGDAKDLEIGQAIGRAVEVAYRMKKPFMFQILSDGGVYSQDGNRNWQGDSGDRSLSIIGYFHPTEAPKMRRLQVGNYVNGQGANRDTVVGSNTSVVAYAAVANYLAACGRTDLFDQHIPRSILAKDKIDDVLIFG